jgi:hypothetical protein
MNGDVNSLFVALPGLELERPCRPSEGELVGGEKADVAPVAGEQSESAVEVRAPVASYSSDGDLLADQLGG